MGIGRRDIEYGLIDETDIFGLDGCKRVVGLLFSCADCSTVWHCDVC